MFVTRSLTWRALIGWLLRHSFWLILFNGTIAVLYAYGYLQLSLPCLPVAVIGTAVAFFVNFKNNQAYDRMWEARKIWGGIVNDSRSWGMMVDSCVRSAMGMPESEVLQWKQKLIYRHIAWLYTHRIQLLEPMTWEQQGAKGFTERTAKRYEKYYGMGVFMENVNKEDIKKFLSESEFNFDREHYQSKNFFLPKAPWLYNLLKTAIPRACVPQTKIETHQPYIPSFHR